MARTTPGRMTHHHEGELVVFMIGMKINNPLRVDQWVPVFRAMPPMIRELATDPDSGMLGYRLVFDLRGPWLVQYWDSLDKLYAYAGDREARHRPAWTAFNRRARRAPGVVGIWHETFVVDKAESMYVGMPAEGLAGATSVVPVSKRLDRARGRMAESGRAAT